MSGPQGSDPNQPWSPPSGQQPGPDQPSAADEETVQAQTWQQPAYPPPQQYPAYPAPPAAAPQPSAPAPAAPQYQQPGQYPGAEQYGQPGQYPPAYPQYGQQQYGQPGQPQYGQQFAPYSPPGAEQGSKRSLAVIGGVVGVLAAVVVAVVLVLGFWKPGFFVTTKLDVAKAQAGVQQVLTDETNGYGAKNVQDVKCNNGTNPTVKKGDSFSCEVSIDGTKRQVTVTFQDNSGTYEVGRPR